MKNKIWILGLALAIGSVLVLFGVGRVSTEKGLALIESAYSGGWSKGEKSAKAVLVEYSDFQCPACRLYYPIVEQLVKDCDGELDLIYRHFPLAQIHRNALPAALAAEAAGTQGKFWEMHNLLFDNQDIWKDLADPKSAFEAYANTIGLDIVKFRADISSEKVMDSVKESYKSGLKMGLQGTPTFFLNGDRIDNPKNYDEFKNIIQKAISS